MPFDVNGLEYDPFNPPWPKATTWMPRAWPAHTQRDDYPFVPYEPGQSGEMVWAQNYAFLHASGTSAMNGLQARTLAIAFLELYQLVYPRSAAIGPPYPSAPHLGGLAPVLGARTP